MMHDQVSPGGQYYVMVQLYYTDLIMVTETRSLLILGNYSLPSITSLTKYTKGTTTYDAGKASYSTVSDPGTYDAQ